MEKYVIISTQRSDNPAAAGHLESGYYDTFAEANAELHRRFVEHKKAGRKSHFSQAVTTREV